MSSMKDTNLRTAEQLGAVIRLKRKEKDLTQSELAKLLGAERKWVINIESGNSKAEIGLVLRALEALNLRASLTDGDKPKSRGTLRDASPLDEVFRNLQGKSMQEFLRAEPERLAARPSIDARIQQVRKRKRATQTRISSKQILENRNADRR